MVELGGFLQVSGLRMHTLAPASFAVNHNRDLEKVSGKYQGVGQGRQLVKRMVSFFTLLLPSSLPQRPLPSPLCKGSGLQRL